MKTRLEHVEPQLADTVEEKRVLKTELERLRAVEKDLLRRENSLKQAEKNYYKSVSSSALDELKKFD